MGVFVSTGRKQYRDSHWVEVTPASKGDRNALVPHTFQVSNIHCWVLGDLKDILYSIHPEKINKSNLRYLPTSDMKKALTKAHRGRYIKISKCPVNFTSESIIIFSMLITFLQNF